MRQDRVLSADCCEPLPACVVAPGFARRNARCGLPMVPEFVTGFQRGLARRTARELLREKALIVRVDLRIESGKGFAMVAMCVGLLEEMPLPA